ncbi:hypothetical protein AB833_17295 [Chromatiales bacterium (ex Bugula neritina AB1)]|nr:hypothetical protein AB833_17295 [Chromatiales bacterium (ex Bugula neritina AB1)]
MKAAVLVDGGFYIKKYVSAWRKKREVTKGYPDPLTVVDELYTRSLSNISSKNKHLDSPKELYRILFYDCKPFSEGSLNPVSKIYTDYARTETATFRNSLHDILKKKRKVALRLGRIAEKPRWLLTAQKTKEILSNPEVFSPFEDDDVRLDIRQKGVDMKIGLDIASLALKKMVDQIILISGDSDFVPAAKLARREGIDFILDTLGNHINDDLHEHIDALLSQRIRID